MSKPSLAVVIVEDDHHEMLVRRYLKKRGLENHQMTIERSPSGEGSAENWVRETFAKEVIRYRNRSQHAHTALIVVIDADVRAVQDRLRQLDDALRTAGRPPVDTKIEEIARLVPKRNVETWILCLNEQPVNEATDYKRNHNNWSELIPPAAATLAEWTRSKDEPPNHCVDSLRNSINELRRLHF